MHNDFTFIVVTHFNTVLCTPHILPPWLLLYVCRVAAIYLKRNYNVFVSQVIIHLMCVGTTTAAVTAAAWRTQEKISGRTQSAMNNEPAVRTVSFVATLDDHRVRPLWRPPSCILHTHCALDCATIRDPWSEAEWINKTQLDFESASYIRIDKTASSTTKHKFCRRWWQNIEGTKLRTCWTEEEPKYTKKKLPRNACRLSSFSTNLPSKSNICMLILLDRKKKHKERERKIYVAI